MSNYSYKVFKKFRQRSILWLPRLLSNLSEGTLDQVTRQARDLQHREEDGWFRNQSTGEWQRCRMESVDWDDAYMTMSGCSSEFANDFRKKDLRDGCPRCSGDVLENASEPDVMSRWGLK